MARGAAVTGSLAVHAIAAAIAILARGGGRIDERSGRLGAPVPIEIVSAQVEAPAAPPAAPRAADASDAPGGSAAGNVGDAAGRAAVQPRSSPEHPGSTAATRTRPSPSSPAVATTMRPEATDRADGVGSERVTDGVGSERVTGERVTGDHGDDHPGDDNGHDGDGNDIVADGHGGGDGHGDSGHGDSGHGDSGHGDSIGNIGDSAGHGDGIGNIGDSAAHGNGIGFGAGGGIAPPPADLQRLPTPEPIVHPASRARPPRLIYPVREREVDDSLLFVARLTVDRDGFVVGARLVHGPGGGRDDHATGAVWRFRYSPALDDDGRPVAATIEQRFLVE